MLSLKLWRAINRPPPRSPLFRRAYTQKEALQPVFPLRVPLVGLFKNAGLIVLPMLLIMLGAPILALLYYLSLLLTPILVPLANTIYGLAHTYGASGRIARERDQQTYDVLCTAPSGMLGMHWSYCTGWLYHHLWYRYAALGVLVTGIVASVFGLSVQTIFGPGSPSMLVPLVRAAALGVIFILDYVQTPVLSSLTTLIVPSYAENEGTARLRATSMFLALQMAVYLPTLLLGVYALPTTFQLLTLDPLLSDLLPPLLMLAFFAVLRETIIVGLWHTVQQELSATRMELDAITQRAV